MNWASVLFWGIAFVVIMIIITVWWVKRDTGDNDFSEVAEKIQPPEAVSKDGPVGYNGTQFQ